MPPLLTNIRGTRNAKRTTKRTTKPLGNYLPQVVVFETVSGWHWRLRCLVAYASMARTFVMSRPYV